MVRRRAPPVPLGLRSVAYLDAGPPKRNPITDRQINDVLDRLHARARLELPGLVVHLALEAVRGLMVRNARTMSMQNMSSDRWVL